MGYQSRDWRQSDQSRNQGRNDRGEESRRFRGGRSGWDDPDAPRSADGIGDYGGYSDRDYESSGRFGGYAEEETAYRGDYSPRHSRRDESEDREGRRSYGNQSSGNQGHYERGNYEQQGYGQSRSGQSGFERDPGYESSRYGGERSRDGDNEPDFRTQPWRDRSQEGWSGERYPHRDFTSGRGGDSESGSSSRGRYGQGGGYGPSGYGQSGFGEGSGHDWRSGSMASAYDPEYRGDSGYGSSGSSRLRSWGQQDSSRGVSHRGKGPKGYERSDDRLKEVICERLSDDHEIDASEISVSVTGGNVRLTGTVESRTQKYAVEEMIANCSGVKDVDNQLRVQSGQSNRSSQSDASRDNSLGFGSSTSGQESAGRSTPTATTSTPGTKKQ